MCKYKSETPSSFEEDENRNIQSSIFICFLEGYKFHVKESRITKGHLISKGLFAVFNSSKRQTETSRPEVS